MSEQLAGLKNNEKGKGGVVVLLGFLLLINALCAQAAVIISISGMIHTLGMQAVLGLFLANSVLILGFTSYHRRLLESANRRKSLLGMLLLLAVLYALVRLAFTLSIPAWVAYALLFLTGQQQFFIFPLVFWVMANDLFTSDQSKSIFPKITAWNTGGLGLGLLAAALSPAFLSARGGRIEDFLLFNLLLTLLSFLLLFAGLRKNAAVSSVSSETPDQNIKQALEFIRDVPSFKLYLSAAMMLGAVNLIVEYHFLATAAAVYQGQAFFQVFYSYFNLGILLLTVLLQGFVINALVKKMHAKVTFLFFPLAAGLAAVGMLLVPGLAAAASAFMLVLLSRDTIHQSGRKNMQAVIPKDKRSQISRVFGSYAPALGRVLGSMLVLLSLWFFGGDALPYLALAVVFSLAALVYVFKMGKVYDSSMLSWRFERRKKREKTINTVLLDRISE